MFRETEINLGALPDVLVYHGKQPDVQEITRIFTGTLICPKVQGWGYNLVITPLVPKRVIGKVGRVI